MDEFKWLEDQAEQEDRRKQAELDAQIDAMLAQMFGTEDPQ